MKVKRKEKKRMKDENSMPVTIRCGFRTLEQKIIWEAVVLPEIQEVLLRYGKLLMADGQQR